MPSPTTGLLPSFLAAIQASLSVLLVISYGSLASYLSLLSPSTTSQISKICVRMFLPALLLTQIGSELHLSSAHRYVAILLWAFFCHFVSFLIGVGAHYGFGMEDWCTAAVMFNNTTSYPLLLIQSLAETGILGSLVPGGNERMGEGMVGRAKSYFLVFATVSSCLTFAVGPRLVEGEHAPEIVKESEEESVVDDGGEEGSESEDPRSPTDETGLLLPPAARHGHHSSGSVGSLKFFPSRNNSRETRDNNPTLSKPMVYDRRPSVIASRRWRKLEERTKWWLLFFYDFLNAPLIGAVLGAIIGLIPALHIAFFADTQDGGIFTAWLTASLKSIGGLFVPLPVVVAGVSLWTAYQETRRGRGGRGTPWATTGFILVVRFVLWPVMSIALVWGMVRKTDWLGEDPMLWFAMMLMPTGPPAMK
jgi:predicted permease